jgi:hypothetical protein
MGEDDLVALFQENLEQEQATLKKGARRRSRSHGARRSASKRTGGRARRDRTGRTAVARAAHGFVPSTRLSYRR